MSPRNEEKRFLFDLPERLIAQTPLQQRDASRLLVVNRGDGALAHRHFTDLPEYIHEGDCLVLNNSRVLPARLMGLAEGRTTPIEVVLLRDLGDGLWECLTRPGRKTREGVRLSFGDGKLAAQVESVDPKDGNRRIRFHYDGVFLELLDELGTMPLPPYIKEKLDDPERYQTVYSKTPGSAAAPTAGLHFTQELLEAIRRKGVKLAYVTLHVGLGTFRPVKAEEITDHVMHSEFYQMDEESARVINETRASGHDIFAVGTTACRTLETIADEQGRVRAQSGWTDIFIYPGYRFKAVDHLITNFHLPESTLMMLISAFAGRERVMDAYRQAIEAEYRFFSFGDSCLFY
ncbi:tRNA preQ1(34) S-adenosylmethionine ribosyltransferase-isomerase QueA [Clostridiaceae bacterium]|nr:tRNA preQ1(34) S-adenosylmethionine ribosyltransferase-isomerase QueA [Clostridiaceae bacterium]